MSTSPIFFPPLPPRFSDPAREGEDVVDPGGVLSQRAAAAPSSRRVDPMGGGEDFASSGDALAQRVAADAILAGQKLVASKVSPLQPSSVGVVLSPPRGRE